ncbi:hypothetical protein M2356_004576, partial [Citrobacter farmeri]|nr:hypothetical protein [Citrobacter farmeri]
EKMTTTIPNLIFQEETNECGLACVAMLAQTQEWLLWHSHSLFFINH